MDDLYKLLTNPLSFGVAISLFLEGTPFFQDKNRSDYAKIGIVLGICLIWSVALSALSATGLPVTPEGWGKVLALGTGVALSTQLAHKLITRMFPWLGEVGINLSKARQTVTVTATTAQQGVAPKTTASTTVALQEVNG